MKTPNRSSNEGLNQSGKPTLNSKDSLYAVFCNSVTKKWEVGLNTSLNHKMFQRPTSDKIFSTKQEAIKKRDELNEK